MTTLPEETVARDADSTADTDVVVVGGGAAGLSAGVFLARYGVVREYVAGLRTDQPDTTSDR